MSSSCETATNACIGIGCLHHTPWNAILPMSCVNTKYFVYHTDFFLNIKKQGQIIFCYVLHLLCFVPFTGNDM